VLKTAGALGVVWELHGENVKQRTDLSLTRVLEMVRTINKLGYGSFVAIPREDLRKFRRIVGGPEL